MKKPVALLASVLALTVIAPEVSWSTTQFSSGVAAPTADVETQQVVSAASAFLDSLRADQRNKELFDFAPQKSATAAAFKRTGPGEGGPPDGFGGGKQDDHSGKGEHHDGPGQGRFAGSPGGPGGPGAGPQAGFVGEQYGHAVWSNYPVSDVPRPGLRLGSLSAAQRAVAMHLLQVLLSPKGYRKVLDIMGSDQALSVGEKHFAGGEDVYTIAIFGTPSVTSPWMLEFGGHHLGLNVVIVGAHGVMTPTLTGVQPSVYTTHGKTVRVLAGENDKAFALLNALDGNQRKQAILN